MNVKSCAVIGHRPTRFKFGYKEHYAGCKRLKKRLHEQFALLYEKGVRHFYVGGSLGVDMWAGELILRMKEQVEYKDIDLYIILPFEGHDTSWDERSKARMTFLRKHCTNVMVIATQNQSPAEIYRKRNEYLIERADVMVAVYDNNRSVCNDTGVLVCFAEEKGIPIILIHPDSGVVSW